MRLMIALSMLPLDDPTPHYEELRTLLWPVVLLFVAQLPRSLTYLAVSIGTNVKAGDHHNTHFAQIPWAEIARVCRGRPDLGVIRIEISPLCTHNARFKWTERRISMVSRHFEEMPYTKSTSCIARFVGVDVYINGFGAGDGGVLVLFRSVFYYNYVSQLIGNDVMVDKVVSGLRPTGY